MEQFLKALDFGQLLKLEYLDLIFIPLETVFSEAYFTNLVSLNFLGLSECSLAFDVSSDWIPSFQLNAIHLSSYYCTVAVHNNHLLSVSRSLGTANAKETLALT